MKSFKQIKQEALHSLRGNWSIFVLAIVICIAIYILISPLEGRILYISRFIVSILIECCFVNLSLAILDENKVAFERIFIFRRKFCRVIKASLLRTIYILLPILPTIIYLLIGGYFLWKLIFFVGLIYSIYLVYKYIFVVYIILDTDMSIKEAFKESSRITYGVKFEIIIFELSFIGWCILVPLTFGILAFYVFPYMFVSHANLYKTIAEERKIFVD